MKSKKSKSWEPVVKGDIVEMVAPASRCSEYELKSAIKTVESLGLTPRLPANIFDGSHPILSNTDQNRFKFLKSALLAKDSKLIWCLRGGYGSIRLIPQLAELKSPRQVKLLVGLSDISTLHNFVNQNWGWPSLHGPMLGTFHERSQEEKTEVLNIIFGKQSSVTFQNLIPLNLAAEKAATIVAPVTGGNLMTVQSSQGTPWAFHSKNSIVFFEEINERGYRIDRLMVSLLQSGYFKQAKAIVLGDFLGGEEPDGKNFVENVLSAFAKELKIPVLKGLRSGHGDLRRSVPFATEASLDLKLRTLTVATNCGKKS